MVRGRDPGYIPGKFDQRMLKPATGSQKRHPTLPGMTDRLERALHVPVGARRNHPNAPEGGQFARRVEDSVGRYPFEMYRNAECIPGEGKRPWDRLVGDHIRVVVPNQGYGRFVRHIQAERFGKRRPGATP